MKKLLTLINEGKESSVFCAPFQLVLADGSQNRLMLY